MVTTRYSMSLSPVQDIQSSQQPKGPSRLLKPALALHGGQHSGLGRTTILHYRGRQRLQGFVEASSQITPPQVTHVKEVSRQ